MSVTPVAQSVLPQKDLGVGTALVTFVNSLSTLFAAAINGVVYGMSANNVQAGVNKYFQSYCYNFDGRIFPRYICCKKTIKR